MKGFGATRGHAFEEPLISYHLQRARAGDFESARWLCDNVKVALRAEHHVDPYVLFQVEQMRKGGLRKSRRLKSHGKRGKTLGDHWQLLLAVAMWKQIKLAQVTLRTAQQRIAQHYSRSADGARNAYYRFAKAKNLADRRVFFTQLKLDYIDNPANWETLARSSEILSRELEALGKLSSF